jgi:hypothetical protein
LLTFGSGHPEVQEKIRRVIKQGHIDADDFNGVSEDADSHPSLSGG